MENRNANTGSNTSNGISVAKVKEMISIRLILLLTNAGILLITLMLIFFAPSTDMTNKAKRLARSNDIGIESQSFREFTEDCETLHAALKKYRLAGRKDVPAIGSDFGYGIILIARFMPFGILALLVGIIVVCAKNLRKHTKYSIISKLFISMYIVIAAYMGIIRILLYMVNQAYKETSVYKINIVEGSFIFYMEIAFVVAGMVVTGIYKKKGKEIVNSLRMLQRARKA